MTSTQRVRHNSLVGNEHIMGGHMEGILFGVGNPLLDISAEVTAEFLQKYNLEADNAILADDSHKNLCLELAQQFKVDYVPGGATQNSLRIAQWLIGVPNAVTFMGCIGKDKFGEILEAKVAEAGVNAKYMYHPTEPTGTCAVCLTGNHRSLVAYLAAANHFKRDHLDVPENRGLLEKAQYYYNAGFPLTVCPDALLEIARYASTNDRVYAFNLSAPFLCSVFKTPMMELMPYVDILFGNELEADAFAKAHNYGTTNIKEIAMRIARLPKENGKRGRMIIFTQGCDPIIVVREGRLYEYPVIPIDPKDIVDTNGAGDAFVGGFLSQLVQGGSMEDCIRASNYAANYIIQQSGCQLPDRPNFSPNSVGF